MREIILKHKQVVLVDDEDYEYLSQFTWHYGKYITRPNWLLEGLIRHKPRVILMHREIMKCTDPNLEVDHINHDTRDNRKCNLRICTSGQNTSNRRPKKGKDSKYLGVHKVANGWKAYIGSNKKNKYLGQFNTENEAAIAYNNAAMETHKEYANLNVIS